MVGTMSPARRFTRYQRTNRPRNRGPGAMHGDFTATTESASPVIVSRSGPLGRNKPNVVGSLGWTITYGDGSVIHEPPRRAGPLTVASNRHDEPAEATTRPADPVIAPHDRWYHPLSEGDCYRIRLWLNRDSTRRHQQPLSPSASHPMTCSSWSSAPWQRK